MKRFSANLGFLWAKLPLLDRIDAAAAAGFGAVELHWPFDTAAEAVRDACVRHNLRILSLNTHRGDLDAGEFGLAALSGRQQAFRESLRQSVAYARIAGSQAIHVMAGIATNNADSRATLAENLLWAEQEAPDMKFLLEPLNTFDKPGYFYNLPAQACAIIMQNNLRHTKLMFDAYHVGREGLNIVDQFDQHADIIGHIQIASVPARHEPYGGAIDITTFLQHLAKRQWHGMIGCEYVPERNEADGLPGLRRLSLELAAQPASAN